VKSETQELQNKIFANEQFKYNYPLKEVEFIYENESKDAAANEKKIIIEIPKKRPEWFDTNLISKVNTQK
jgi:hypothetical protein